MTPNRRLFLQMGPPAVAAFALSTCSRSTQTATPTQTAIPNRTAQTNTLPPTSTCGESSVTPTQTPGSFYTPESPERTSLREPDNPGTPIVLVGQALSASCDPIANALLDFWHTNAQGEYDNSDYRFRGHQFTDNQGYYRLETIIPGIYPGRTRHFHVKVQAPNNTPLTTQLYFPEEPFNIRDGLFQPELLISLRIKDLIRVSE